MREYIFGDINKVYAEWSYKFYDYLYKVSENNIRFINLSTNGVNVITIAFFLVYVCFIIYEVYHMRRFYKRLFQIEVSPIFKIF